MLWSEQYYQFDVKNCSEGQTLTTAAITEYHDGGDILMTVMLMMIVGGIMVILWPACCGPSSTVSLMSRTG